MQSHVKIQNKNVHFNLLNKPKNKKKVFHFKLLNKFKEIKNDFFMSIQKNSKNDFSFPQMKSIIQKYGFF